MSEDKSIDFRSSPLTESNRPWLSPITHTAHTVYTVDETCHKTLEEALSDAQRHASYGGDSGEANDSHPDAGHEAGEKPYVEAQEKSARAGEAREHKGEY